MSKWWLAMAAALLLLSGCGEKPSSSNNQPAAPSTSPAPGETIVPVKDKLPSFPPVSDPYTIEQAEANGDVIDVHGKLHNPDRWKLFLANIDAGVPDQVRITQYTIEGDPIFSELVYDGAEAITYTFDNSMDGFGNDLGRPSTVCRSVELKEEAEIGAHYVLTGCEDSDVANTFWFSAAEFENAQEKNQVSLFDGILDFNGTEEIDMPIGKEQVKAAFSRQEPASVYPFGFYVPDSVVSKDFEDGNEWYLGESILTLMDYNENHFTGHNVIRLDAFKQYKEYAGSIVDENGRHEDYFLFEKESQKYMLRWSYLEKDAEATIPMFTAVSKELRYVKQEQ